MVTRGNEGNVCVLNTVNTDRENKHGHICAHAHTHTHTHTYQNYSFPDFSPYQADSSALLKVVYYHYPSIDLNTIIRRS